jgi:hypothetical protein
MNMNYFIIHYRFPHPLITRYDIPCFTYIYLIRKGAENDITSFPCLFNFVTINLFNFLGKER